MAILLSGNLRADVVSGNNLLLAFHGYYEEINYHIVLGDGGLMRPGNKKKDYSTFKTLSFRPFPVLCLSGSHEPAHGLKNIDEVDIGLGEPVLKIHDNPFVAYLKRGKVYTINGIKFLVLGGALSLHTDKTRHKNGHWSEQEKNDLYRLLETDNKFDFVISNTGPRFINDFLFKDASFYNEKSSDEIAIFYDEIHSKIQFIEWWCGHRRNDIYYYDEKTERGYQYLHRRVRILEKADNKFILINEYGMLNR